MSNPEQRRAAPRASGMHPGWACFLAAFGAGIFTMIAMAAAVRWMMGWDRLGMLLVTGGIALALFIIGGRKAEKLREIE